MAVRTTGAVLNQEEAAAGATLRAPANRAEVGAGNEACSSSSELAGGLKVLPVECAKSECPGQFVAAGLAQWAASLEHLHRRVRAGALDPCALAMYQASRDELERTVLLAQQVANRVRRGRRQAVRLACALQLDLRIGNRSVRAVTLDVSKRGFATLLESPPRKNEVVEFSLRLPGSRPVKGKARVAGLRRNDGNTRTSFAFVDVPENEMERVQMWIVENVVHHLTLC